MLAVGLRVRHLLLLGVVGFGWFGACPFLRGATAPVFPPPKYDVWQPAAGWQQGPATAVVQGAEGYVWLASYHGLVRFDGVRFVVFDSGNTPGLTNGLITSLHVGVDGVLWVGHETGHVTRCENGSFHPVPLRDSWPGGPVEAIATDEVGDVWCLNDAGTLYRLRDGNAVRVANKATPLQRAAVVGSPGGDLWVVENGNAFSLQRGTLVPLPVGNGSNDYVNLIAPARDGGSWVVRNDRLHRWSGVGSLADFPHWPRAFNAVTTLLEMRSGTLLVGTLRDGLYVLSPGAEAQHFSRTNGLSHNWVRSLCEDHEGNVWVGTGAAFDGLRVRKAEMLIPPDGFQGCGALSFVVRLDGSLWVGTEGAGLYRFDHERWTRFGEGDGLPTLFVWSLLETRKRQLLIGTWGGGLLTWETNRAARPAHFSAITAPITALYEDRREHLWIGTTSGLYHYDGESLTLRAGKAELFLPDVRAITETPDGTLWLGLSGGGLASQRNGVYKQFRRPDGLRSDFVISLWPEPDNTLWIGTSDQGLVRLAQGEFGYIGTEHGLPSRVIARILDDRRGNLWLGTYAGVLRANKAELNHCAAGLTNSVTLLRFGRAEGLATEACSAGFQPGSARTVDGRLWFSTGRGLATIDPENVFPNTEPPPVIIEEMIVDGRHLLPPATPTNLVRGAAGPLAIPPGRQRFRFHYAGLSFLAPERVRFKCRLEGLESDWREVGTARTAEFSYLPPGDYVFRVIGCNNDGVWCKQEASLAFSVSPWFWQTWWFQAASLASGVLAIGAGVRFATRHRLRRRLEQLERQRALERERARIARDIHDDLGASLTRITLLSQTARAETDHTRVAEELDQIYHTATDLTRAMDEIVWAVNPRHDSLDSLVSYLGRYAQHFLATAGIRCRLDLPLHLPACALSSEVRHNLFLALKEALHNVVKHARATEARLALELRSQVFAILLADNGCGFDPRMVPASEGKAEDPSRLASGNGLLNIRKRLEQVGGRCEWLSTPGEGTRVRLVVPLPEPGDPT